MTNFDTILVANRGEIAVRILRTAKAHGYRTVAVFSDADAEAPHVLLADEAVHLGASPARDSYLDGAKVIAAAKTAGAQAIHPGYGFLSENADFAQACANAGLVFIGPTPENIVLMGDKAAAKRRMADAGVPLLAGYQGEQQDDARLLTEAEAVGFPLMVKAAAGGGGKGMRLVAEPSELPGAIAAARREALAAFGSDVLILERALLRPRHVEIQVLADTHGHVIALGERDCSVQRRHQKVVEEAPSPALDEDTRDAMQHAAVAAAKDIGYVGAGTVEFLLGQDGTFAFLEMNTRLQVEHPVTEMITGLDLVDWQLRIAAGEHLTIQQADVPLDGHAIEVRLYAEDPANDFLPQTGRVHRWQPPTGPGIRVDAGISTGSEVTPHYDPMVAKIIAHGRTRDEARRRLAEALDATVLLGVRTNRTFLASILRDEVFADGGATTAFLTERDPRAAQATAQDLAAIAGRLHFERTAAASDRSPGLGGFTNAPWLRSRQSLRIGHAVFDVTVGQIGNALHVEVDAQSFTVAPGNRPGSVTVDGRRHDVATAIIDDAHGFVHLRHLDAEVHDDLLAAADQGTSVGAGVLVAPMHGVVTAVSTALGTRVAAGDPVIAIEAMKMEHVLRADVAGTVAHLAAVGTQVGDGDVLATITPDDVVPDKG